MRPTWKAFIEYDEGRLGRMGIVGAESREACIAWLTQGFNWKLCWYLQPSWVIVPPTTTTGAEID